MHKNLRKSWSNGGMVLKTVFLFCLLTLALCAVSNDGMSLSPNAVSF
jgi:hypothetical protein